jgi:hypothetical protein
MLVFSVICVSSRISGCLCCRRTQSRLPAAL